GTRVRAARLLPREPRLQHARGQVEHVAELDRLCEVVVEDRALVLDDHAPCIAAPEVIDDPDLRLHTIGITEDTEVLEHRLTELVADLPRTLPGIDVEDLLDPRLCTAPCPLPVAVRRGRAAVESVLGGVTPRAPAEGDRLHQRVPAEPI